jgi:NAD(P)-dependent dehydrogenase (short-subunit alcohol dehydrogenase family)
VCINYASNEDAAEAVVGDIRATGGRAIAVRGDVADESDVELVFTEATERLGTVTGLVNNAGIMGSGGRVDEMDWGQTRRMFDVNLLGPMLCCKVAIRRMAHRHGGRGGAIVNISSGAARHGGVGSYIDFATSKAALDRFTTAVAQEQAPEGVRINAIRPGLIMTEGNRAWSETHPDWLASVLERTPIGRAGEMEEVAAATLWLLSEDASFVTGRHWRRFGDGSLSARRNGP